GGGQPSLDAALPSWEKYEAAQREREIQSQRADLAIKELNINQKNTQIIGLVVLALVLSVLGYLLYKQQKLKNKQLQKEAELKERSEEHTSELQPRET